MLYKKLNASPVEKTAIDATTVDSDSSNVQLHFKSDDPEVSVVDALAAVRRRFALTFRTDVSH